LTPRGPAPPLAPRRLGGRSGALTLGGRSGALALAGPLIALALAAGCDRPPAPTTAPAPLASAAGPSQGPVLPHETFTIDSAALGETRRINVYTPPSYAERGGERYPLLYMPDGGVGEDFPHVIAAADAAIRAGEMRPVVVVGVENTERRRDLSGPTEVESDRKVAPRVGGSARFRAFLRDELMPSMRERVRGDGRTAIVGESLAGLFVIETLFVAPDMFDAYAALSPSLWWNGGALTRDLAVLRKARPGPPRTLFMSVAGDDDVDGAVEALARALRADPPPGLRFLYEPMPRERHDTIYRAAEARVLRALFPPDTTR
jgi:predicted alpha/beta superfamily hydrolase